MKVFFANQKGGCGKSTLLILFASYLKKKHNKNVAIIDTDRQRTVYFFYENEKKTFEEKPLLDVFYLPPEQALQTIQKMPEDDTIILIDTPNQLNEVIFQLLLLGDKVVVPYNYSKGSMASTKTFLAVYKKFCPERLRDLFVVASAIKSTAKADKLLQFKEEISTLITSENVLTNDFKDTVQAQRIDIINVPDGLLNEFEIPLNELAKKLQII